jgi:hypothetical protein
MNEKLVVLGGIGLLIVTGKLSIILANIIAQTYFANILEIISLVSIAFLLIITLSIFTLALIRLLENLKYLVR